MPDGPPVGVLNDTPSTGRLPRTITQATTAAPATRLILGGLALLFGWQTILVGLTSMFADHATHAGAQAVSALGYGTPQERAEVQRRALARLHGRWADRGHFHFVVDRREVRVTVDVPVLLPSLHTPWKVRSETKIHHT